MNQVTEQQLDRHRHMTLGKVVMSVAGVLIPILIAQAFAVTWYLSARSVELASAISTNVKQDNDIADVQKSIAITAREIKTEQKEAINDLEDSIDEKFTAQNKLIDVQLDEIKKQIIKLDEPSRSPGP